MASLGLLQFQSANDIASEEEAERQRREEERRQAMVESSLAAHIRRNWESAKTAKQEVERRMLDALRRRKGEYSAEKLRAIREEGGADLYMMLTATKCRAASSWVRDILMPPGDERPWGLEPTPVADIPAPYVDQVTQEVRAQAMQAQQQGQQVDMQAMLEDAKEQMRTKVQKLARKAADRHEDKIDDQLAEGGWLEALEAFIDDFTTYPAAVLKGPVLRRVPTLEWTEGWKPVKTMMVQPQFERVSPFDLYPSADATTPDDASSLFERQRFTRAHLSQLRGVPGYNDEALDEVLREYGQGGLRDWLWTDGERAELEGRGHEWLSGNETIDGLQYWGSAQGLVLLQWGLEPDVIDDPLADYEIEAILIGRHVVRCVINRDPLDHRPYHTASYQPVPGSFWGQSIPELMADIQDTCNATARALVNNMAIASGPQTEVTDRLQPGEDPYDFRPWKVWRTKSSQVVANDPAIRFYQPNSNASELMGVYEKFEIKADDATNIPRYSYGNEKVGGAAQTASGLSMLMESANKGIKDAIRHIDRGVIRRVIGGLWLFNMQYDPDESIKGDCRAVPRGSSAMLQREQTQQLRQQFLQLTANQFDMNIVGVEGRAKVLRTIAEQLDIPDLIPDDREIQQNQAQQQKAQQAQQQLEQLKAKAEAAEKQARATEAQADAEQTKAETQIEQQKAPYELRQLLADVIETLSGIEGYSNGDNGAAMEGDGQAPQIGRLANDLETTRQLPTGGQGRAGNGAGLSLAGSPGQGVPRQRADRGDRSIPRH